MFYVFDYYFLLIVPYYILCTHKERNMNVHTIQSSFHTCLSVLSLGNKQATGSRDPGCVDKVMARTHNSLDGIAEHLPGETAGFWTKLLWSLYKHIGTWDLIQQLTAHICFLKSCIQGKTQEVKWRKLSCKHKKDKKKKDRKEEGHNRLKRSGLCDSKPVPGGAAGLWHKQLWYIYLN